MFFPMKSWPKNSFCTAAPLLSSSSSDANKCRICCLLSATTPKLTMHKKRSSMAGPPGQGVRNESTRVRLHFLLRVPRLSRPAAAAASPHPAASQPNPPPGGDQEARGHPPPRRPGGGLAGHRRGARARAWRRNAPTGEHSTPPLPVWYRPRPRAGSPPDP